jgi:hypothetical protein
VFDQELLCYLGILLGKATCEQRATVLHNLLDEELSGSISKTAFVEALLKMSVVALKLNPPLGIGEVSDGLVSKD